jgi:colicin import membrane protein
MTSGKTTTIRTAARPTCKYPGCGQPAAPAGHPCRPPEYCAGRGHTRVSAWRERRRLTAEKNDTVLSPADDASPVTMAKMTGTELLRSLRAEADRVAALGTALRDRIDTLADPTAAEAEVEAVRAAAKQRAVTAEAKAADAGRRAAEADRFRAEADAAAEQMSEELAVAQDRAQDAEQRAREAEADRDSAVARARADADAKVTSTQAERDAAIAQARADAAREREELRADLRARAERAEQQADAYRAELGRVRTASPDAEPAEPPAKSTRRGTRT